MKLRDIANVLLDRISRYSAKIRLILQNALYLTHSYQPDPFSSSFQADPRACRARYEAIDKELKGLKYLSVLDIGCNQGYFTFRFAEKGGVCLGIDNDRAELMAARSRAEVQKVRNVSFLELTLDSNTIAGLPVSDVVVCLSIFHHWVRRYGKAGAEKMLFELSKKASEVLVFDTGQPEEIDMLWSDELNFMKPTSLAWVTSHLNSIGFKNVRNVGVFPTSVSSVPRSLFVATRN